MKRLLLIIYILISSTSLFAGGSKSFSLSYEKDIIIGISSVVFYGSGFLLTEFSHAKDMDKLGWPDEFVEYKFNETLDEVGDLLTVSSALALPLLLDEWSFESVSTIGVMYLESISLLYGMKNTVKGLIKRPRPYNFIISEGENEEERREELTEEDRNFSFPSGHTAISFMTATFSTYIYNKGNSSKKSKIIMGVSSYSLALVASSFRIYAGVHYPIDLAAGAILGSGIGLLIPSLHLNLPENSDLVVCGDFIGLSVRL